MSQYETDLGRNAANYTPLSPLTFIERAAAVYPDRTAQIHGEKRYSWAETYRRCRQLAGALEKLGVVELSPSNVSVVSRIVSDSRSLFVRATLLKRSDRVPTTPTVHAVGPLDRMVSTRTGSLNRGPVRICPSLSG